MKSNKKNSKTTNLRDRNAWYIMEFDRTPWKIASVKTI